MRMTHIENHIRHDLHRAKAQVVNKQTELGERERATLLTVGEAKQTGEKVWSIPQQFCTPLQKCREWRQYTSEI